MYGNGAVTGTATTAAALRPTRKVRLPAPTACCAAVAGTTERGAAECRTVTSAFPTTLAAAKGSVSVYQNNIVYLWIETQIFVRL